jgi:hypothetical protein
MMRLLLIALTLFSLSCGLSFAQTGEELFRLGRYPDAVQAYAKAAKSGDFEAGFRLGQIYADGVVVKRDMTQAAAYLKPAALAGHAGAQFEYGNLLDNGWGVKKSKTQAAKFFRMAAERNIAAAMFNYGAMLENGEGVKADVVEAFKWYHLAYDRGLDLIVEKPMNELAERLSPDEIKRALAKAASFKPMADYRP